MMTKIVYHQQLTRFVNSERRAKLNRIMVTLGTRMTSKGPLCCVPYCINGFMLTMYIVICSHHRCGHSRARSQSQGSHAPPHQPLRMPMTSSSRRSPSQSSRTHQCSYSRSSRQRQPSRSRSPYQRGRSHSRSSHQHHHGRSGTCRSRSRSRDSQPEHNRLRSHQEGSRTTRATDRQTQSSPARPSYDLTRSLAASMAPTERRDNQMVPASSHSRTHTGRHRSTASSRYSPYPGHRGGHPRQSDQDDGLDQSPSRHRL